MLVCRWAFSDSRLLVLSMLVAWLREFHPVQYFFGAALGLRPCDCRIDTVCILVLVATTSYGRTHHFVLVVRRYRSQIPLSALFACVDPYLVRTVFRCGH